MINIASVEIVQVIFAYRHVENGWFVGPAYHFYYTPVENGTYYGMAMSVRFSVRPSVHPSITLLIMTVSVHFLSNG
jgi:hypothetical protein